jgi:hypothetical protein
LGISDASPPPVAWYIWRGPPRAGLEISDGSPQLSPTLETRPPPASTAGLPRMDAIEDSFLIFLFLPLFLLLDLVEAPGLDLQIFVMDLL